MSKQVQPAATMMNRRSTVRAAGVGALLMLVGGVGALLAGYGPFPKSPAPTVKSAAQGSTAFTPDVEVVLTATKKSAPLRAGAVTAVWSYQGEVKKGDPGAVQTIPNSYLGPIIRVHQGQKVRIIFKNGLSEDSNIHWHGLIVPPAMDGHPKDAVGPGQTYVYEFTVKNRAGTYWYHPHPHGRTGAQVNAGLAGLFIVSDDEEAALQLPQGDADLPLVLQDRRFTDTNQFSYVSPGMESMMGFLGDRILVNGQTDFQLALATRVYRLRLLNGSNSRIYKLAWSNGMPLTVIGTDGGLLPQPVERSYVMLAPGERVELWTDLRQQPVGTDITLQSLAYTGVEAGMMGNMMHEASGIPNGKPLDLLTIQVATADTDTRTLPTVLTALRRDRPQDAVNATHPRQIKLGMTGMNWTLNGNAFVMDAATPEETVKAGSTEIWEFINAQPTTDAMGDGMMEGMDHTMMGHTTAQADTANPPTMQDFMAHPMHIHGGQFQIISREVAAPQQADWQTVKEGFVDDDWKDTVLVMPGERVKVLMRFDSEPGLYLYHCHNLEHEDLGMMRNYQVIK